MAILSGNTTGSVASVPLNIPCIIKSYSIVNRTGGNVNYNVFVSVNGVAIAIRYRTLAAFNSYEEKTNIIVPANGTIIITTSGSVDYYFSLE